MNFKSKNISIHPQESKSDAGQIRCRQSVAQSSFYLEFERSLSTITATGATAMTGLMVGMPGCTGVGTETLAVTDDSTGILNLAGAAGTSAGRQSRCHWPGVNTPSLTLFYQFSNKQKANHHHKLKKNENDYHFHDSHKRRDQCKARKRSTKSA